MSTPNTPNAASSASEKAQPAQECVQCQGVEAETSRYWIGLNDANGMCRSAFQAIDRCANGDTSANWTALRDRMRESLERQHAIMFPNCKSVTPERAEERLARQFAKAAKVIREIAGMGHDSTDKEVADEALRVARLWVNDDSHDVVAIRESQPHAATSAGGDYPECSGDPSCCPENEGFGCCKPNPQPSTTGAVSDEAVAWRSPGHKGEHRFSDESNSTYFRQCKMDGYWPNTVELLYLHPQPSTPGAVSDEDVDAVGSALYIYWNDVKPDAKAAYRKKVRAALESWRIGRKQSTK